MGVMIVLQASFLPFGPPKVLCLAFYDDIKTRDKPEKNRPRVWEREPGCRR
jgi:hypothetical protein